jgi:hypothetical protein
MPELYVAVKSGDDDSEVEYVPISEVDDVSTVIGELPEELIHQHSEFKRVDTLHKGAVDESKRNKKRAQKAEKLLKSLSNPDGDDEDDDEEQDDDETETPTATPSIKIEDVEERVYQRIMNREAEANAHKTTINNLINENGLNDVPDAYNILSSSKNPEETAASLGRLANQFAPELSGEPELGSEEFKKRLNARLGLPD